MSEEPSGSHRTIEPVGTPRWVLYVVIAVLTGGAGGTGLTSLLRSPGADVAVALTEIKGSLSEINHKLDDTKARLDDHDRRIRDLEIATKGK